VFLSGLAFDNNSHNPFVALYNLPSTNTYLFLYLKQERPILKQPSLSSRYTPNVGSCDNLRLDMLRIYFECIDEEPVSTGSTRLGLSDLRSIIGTGIVPVFVFHNLRIGLD
jgi:hypothetical protein